MKADNILRYGTRIPAGEWKYLIDIGNKHGWISPQKQATTISVSKYKAIHYTDSTGLADLEKIFIRSFEKNPREAYKKYGSSHYILNLPLPGLVKSTDSAFLLIHSFSSPLSYHFSGVFVSPGRDMAAVYGRITEPGKTGSYLRIWRCEKNGWKIALEVIRI